MALDTGFYTLNNGVKMPKFGLGTWLSSPGQVKQAVEHAIDVGYRHIDCAHCYGNEHEVGQAIQGKIKDGVVKREDLFITSKLWNNCHRPEHVEIGLDETLKNLKLDYLDLFLIHWPVAVKFIDVNTRFPKDENDLTIMDNDAHFLDTYNEMIKIQRNTTKLRAIGVSNFNAEQLSMVIEKSDQMPQMLQIEAHPFLRRKELIDLCEKHDIRVTGYSPLGNPGRPAGFKNSGDPELMENQTVIEIAKKYGKTTAQLLIRYAISLGYVCIPKSVTPSRIEANSKVFDFEISADDTKAIQNLDQDLEYCYPLAMLTSVFFPFKRK